MATENTIPLIVSAFEQISVNYVPEFFEKQEEYGIASGEEFIKITGLDQQYGFAYAELYEKHLEKLQHNICLDKLDDLYEQISDLNKQVANLTRWLSELSDTLRK